MVSSVQKMIHSLDRCIILLRPTLESLTEGYKIIKSTHALNREIEYFILFEGVHSDARRSFLFERLSGIVSKYLALQINWLGYLQLADGLTGLESNLDLNHLFLKPVRKMASFEKMMLAKFMSAFYPARGVPHAV